MVEADAAGEEAEAPTTEAFYPHPPSQGDRHTLALTYIAILVILYQDQGKLDEAERLKRASEKQIVFTPTCAG